MKEIKPYAAWIVGIMGALALTLGFQNCSKPKSAKTDGGTAQATGGGDPGGTVNPGGNGGGGGGFQTARGDTIFYLSGALMVPQFKSIKLATKHASAFQVVETTAAQGQAIADDLSVDYCKDSALPHCRHINGKNCLGEACAPVKLPVVCYQEVLMNQAQVTQVYGLLGQALSSLSSKVPDPNVPAISDCDDPYLHLYSDVIADVHVSLADKACIPNGTLYPPSGATDYRNAMNGYIASVEAMGAYCNSYARRWNTTSFVYDSVSGFTTPDAAYSYHVEYMGNQKANLRFTDPGQAAKCTNAFTVDASELTAFFPDGGLKYEIYRTGAILADAPSAQIDYKDSEDPAGTSWKFFMDEVTAQAHRGGAVLESTQSTAIKNAVQSLISRAKAQGMAGACP
ncbi:MAG: hypothetical protein AB7F86_12085 [Bdellovibrionales bacterium]